MLGKLNPSLRRHIGKPIHKPDEKLLLNQKVELILALLKWLDPSNLKPENVIPIEKPS